MTHDITGYFDGKSIVPDEPLHLKPGQKLKVRIESIESSGVYPLAAIAALATDMGIDDLSANHKQIATPAPSDED